MTLEKKQREGRETYWMSLKESDIGHTNGLLDTLTANTWKAARTALLTELRESIQTIDFYGWNEQTQSKIKEKVQAHLNELINSTK